MALANDVNWPDDDAGALLLISGCFVRLAHHGGAPMNDTSPAESKPPGPVPADNPGRVLTHVSPDIDESLPHLGVIGDTYTILVSGGTPLGATR